MLVVFSTSPTLTFVVFILVQMLLILFFFQSKVAKLLGAEPNLVFAGANINLTITTDSLSLLDMESGDVSVSGIKKKSHFKKRLPTSDRLFVFFR